MAVQVRDNVIRWSDEFLRRLHATGEKKPIVGLTLGYDPAHDPGELVVAAQDNRLDAPSGTRGVTPLLVRAAEFNSHRITNRRFSLPPETSTAAPKSTRRDTARGGGTPR